MLKRFEWIDAKSAQEATREANATAADLMAAPKNQKSQPAIIKAGGIDLLDLMKDGVLTTHRVVNIRSIAGFDEIKYEKKTGLRLGPLVTLAEIAENREIHKRYTALSDACSHIATPNIRNAATIAGNLLQRPRCWYLRAEDFHCLKKGGKDCNAIHGDNKYHAIFGNELCAIVHPSTAAVALVALGASIEISSPKGTREIKLENFFVTPEKDVLKENILTSSELITAIKLPDEETHSAHIKMGEKDSFDWSTGDCAVSLVMAGTTVKKANIILGAAAPIPWRAKEAEAFLAGKSISRDTAREAGKLALKGATPLSQNEYKVIMLQAAVMRALLKAAGVK